MRYGIGTAATELTKANFEGIASARFCGAHPDRQADGVSDFDSIIIFRPDLYQGHLRWARNCPPPSGQSSIGRTVDAARDGRARPGEGVGFRQRLIIAVTDNFAFDEVDDLFGDVGGVIRQPFDVAGY
jgi:hypothetical protein